MGSLWTMERGRFLALIIPNLTLLALIIPSGWYHSLHPSSSADCADTLSLLLLVTRRVQNKPGQGKTMLQFRQTSHDVTSFPPARASCLSKVSVLNPEYLLLCIINITPVCSNQN